MYQITLLTARAQLADVVVLLTLPPPSLQSRSNCGDVTMLLQLLLWRYLLTAASLAVRLANKYAKNCCRSRRTCPLLPEQWFSMYSLQSEAASFTSSKYTKDPCRGGGQQDLPPSPTVDPKSHPVPRGTGQVYGTMPLLISEGFGNCLPHLQNTCNLLKADASCPAQSLH